MLIIPVVTFVINILWLIEVIFFIILLIKTFSAINTILKMTRKYKYKYSNPFNLDDMDSEKDSIHSIPFWMGLLIILCLSLLFGFVFLMGTLLPTPLTVNDEVILTNLLLIVHKIED